MKYIKTISLMMLSCIVGIIFYAHQEEWIIIVFPQKTTDYQNQVQQEKSTFVQNKVTLFFWKHAQWQKENITVIWSSDLAYNIKTITNSWLMLLEDEKLVDTDIQLLSACMTQSKELFLSFNKDIFSPQDSTYTKLMIVHGLLKTIHENKMPIQSVRFLIHHQTLLDDHLNFSISWPISGY